MYAIISVKWRIVLVRNYEYMYVPLQGCLSREFKWSATCV